ncbi:hypothetical protein [Streptomyces sp. SID1121]|uniref:hypothetical protein n=1 Tax=Streptomyces sp. SID1121 TaxID=3425888 RepID=UPI004057B939
MLWLLDTDVPAAEWPDEIESVSPPLCLPDAWKSVNECHHLFKVGWAAVRAAETRIHGVFGQLYEPGRPAPVPTGVPDIYSYQDPRIDCVLAGQLVRTLSGIRVVDLAEETV